MTADHDRRIAELLVAYPPAARTELERLLLERVKELEEALTEERERCALLAERGDFILPDMGYRTVVEETLRPAIAAAIRDGAPPPTRAFVKNEKGEPVPLDICTCTQNNTRNMPHFRGPGCPPAR